MEDKQGPDFKQTLILTLMRSDDDDDDDKDDAVRNSEETQRRVVSTAQIYKKVILCSFHFYYKHRAKKHIANVPQKTLNSVLSLLLTRLLLVSSLLYDLS